MSVLLNQTDSHTDIALISTRFRLSTLLLDWIYEVSAFMDCFHNLGP